MTRFLLDTHAVIHWQLGTAMPPALADDHSPRAPISR